MTKDEADEADEADKDNEREILNFK